MRNFVLLLICFIFLQPVFAEELSPIEISTRPINLASKLKKNYAAYDIKLRNTGTNPVRVDNIRINTIHDTEKYTNSVKMFSPLSMTLLCLAPFTLGATLILEAPVALYDYRKMRQTMSEATLYSENDIHNTKNITILPEKQVSIKVLVPKDEDLKIKATFEDMITRTYFDL